MTPFAENAAGSLAALGETRLIARIREWLGDATAPAPRGIGDDCAVLPAQPFAGQRLATTDSVLWGRHFDAAVPARAVGEKLVKRNLSDIAAMGGTPADALLSLVCGRDTALAWLAEFFAGVATACRRWHVELAGGDIAAAPDGFFCATLALTGFCEKPLLRTGGKIGDVLLATGELGGSLAGKHFLFEPRLDEGRWLAARPEVHAGMDITDGLAKDVLALLPADAAAALTLTDPHALSDGEDYELLIAADAAAANGLLLEWQEKFPTLALKPIGMIVAAGATEHRLRDAATGKPIFATGYEHF
jgi:thiamine-monophosphate kinase